jgi:DNA (cytosine-5)-methyltransferase 1
VRFLSLFSGIEAASAAWLPLGWECVAVAEIEPFPCKVLAHHYPEVPNLGDITKITKEQIESLGHIDLVVGGFPCQDLSVAGKRKGFTNDDGSTTRSGLFYTALRISRWSNARWLLLENVPGIYSSNNGRDFASMAGEILNTEFAVPKNGWQNSGVAASRTGLLEWRTLDAQFFGVPQRRRRMFALADFGNWTNRQPVLFERDSLQGNPPPSRGKREEVAGTISKCSFTGGAGGRPEGATGNHFIPTGTCIGKETFGTLMANCGTKQWLGNQEALSGDYHVFSLAGNTIGRQPENGGNGNGYDDSGVSYTLTKTDQHAVAFKVRGGCEGGGKGYLGSEDAAFTLSTNQDQHLFSDMQVRRLMPIECERLQGFRETSHEVVICLDHQSNLVNAEKKNHKLPNVVLSVEEKELNETALFADQNLSVKNPLSKSLVAVNAHINLELLTLQIHSQEKLILSVSLAEKKSLYRQFMQLEDIARLLVQQMKELEAKATHGKVESQQNINHSLHQESGNLSVNLCGQEIEELVKDAELFMKKVSESTKFITLEAGLNSENCEKNLVTLCCFVTAAINLFIQEQTQITSLLEINLSVTHGFTNIPGASDSPRYKALGNSMAVPVMRWIGERIQMVEDMQKENDMRLVA